MVLGIAMAVKPFQPLGRSTPEAVRSPVIKGVWVNLYDANRGSVDASWDARIAERAVKYDNQAGGNDCCYWTGDHLAGWGYSAGWGTERTERGINTYSSPCFQCVSNGTTGVRATMISSSRWFDCLTVADSSAEAVRMWKSCSLAEIFGLW